ncbi:M1 family metallopeptidase [Aggregicoccus sp. 17bor-14]|uniref:M1 family metallopeptidase n=1 Tax=Myxococcaceae TaxID=31 RepID=UPI00129CDA88|nr:MULTISPECIES: M1 family metallopeptidase [Myxococcaceae]MBF5044549.1 M1 family metallopeptidase [Simulacricoccus sp. 17bor-14]MRI90294.1 M1 family metallopeptidase [Aggregicoccus sp. 17bor-14]
MAPTTDDKNFRLPLTIRPRRYAATLTLDLQAQSFQGEQTIALSLEKPAQEVVLHAIALELGRVALRAGGRTLTPASVTALPVSETVVLRFAEAVPAGDCELDVAWTGHFTKGLRGLYLAGKVAATQFEAADARRVFPCFDEPAFKARWALSVRVPPGVTALSNGAVVSDVNEGALRRVTFQETEVLSSYLVALVVGELQGCEEGRVGSIPVRTWALPEKKHLTAFGQDVALNVLPRLQDYFGLPYAYGKVDQVGIPDFEAGAMENAGLITYREVALLLDPATAPLSVQKRVAEVVTHELAHQWFGNWVTMVWWDDLWLNEAFATWMAYKIVADWKPQWRVWLDFDAGKAVALHLDALKSTHPIRGEVRNAGEAGESFDAITYEKGGAVLRMIEGYLGEGPFREGIRQYMRTHARSNAVADDLWGALAQASKEPVVELANAWIRQSGYPLVTASLEGGRRLALRQERFYSEPGVESAEQWPVPVVLRYADAGGVREHRVLLREKLLSIELPGKGEVQWLCANAGSTGFYRTAYDARLLAALASQRTALSPAERIGLLADQWALVRSGKAEIGAFLTLAASFRDEEDYAVLDELVGRLAYVESRLTEGPDAVQFRSWVEALLSPQLARVGWDAKAGEGDDQRLRRAALVRAVGGIARSNGALTELRPRVDRMLAGDKGALDANLLDSAVGIAARDGDSALFETLLARFPTEPDPATKRRYLMALTAFEHPLLAAQAQGLLFSETVPMQDVSGFISGLMGNRTGRDGFWDAMRQRWPEVRARTGNAPMLLRRVVEAMGLLRDRKQLEEARAHLKANPVPEAAQATEQTLERLSQDVALRERAMPQVAAWLKAQG